MIISELLKISKLIVLPNQTPLESMYIGVLWLNHHLKLSEAKEK